MKDKTRSVLSITATAIGQIKLLKHRSALHLPVILGHEFGHYYAAKSLKFEKVSPPIIVGVGPFSLGWVKTPKLTPNQRSLVGVYGPIGGMLTSAFISLFAVLISSSFMLTLGIFAFSLELLNLFFGGDSRKIF